MGYVSDNHHHADYYGMHGYYAANQKHDSQPHAQSCPMNDEAWRPFNMPPIPESARSRSSTLANALGDVILKLDSPAAVSSHAPPLQSALPMHLIRDKTSVIADDRPNLMRNDITIAQETGSPNSTRPSTSSRMIANDSPSEAEPQAPRKRARGPNKGPPKAPGFLACYFCRHRKVSCDPPPAYIKDRTCL